MFSPAVKTFIVSLKPTRLLSNSWRGWGTLGQPLPVWVTGTKVESWAFGCLKRPTDTNRNPCGLFNFYFQRAAGSFLGGSGNCKLFKSKGRNSKFNLRSWKPRYILAPGISGTIFHPGCLFLFVSFTFNRVWIFLSLWNEEGKYQTGNRGQPQGAHRMKVSSSSLYVFVWFSPDFSPTFHRTFYLVWCFRVREPDLFHFTYFPFPFL